MALVSTGNDFVFPATVTQYTTSNLLIDGAADKSGCVFFAPATGTITGVLFRIGTVTTSDTIDVRLETVGSDMQPTGTLAGANTNASAASLVSNTWREISLTSSYSATYGELLALVIADGPLPGVFNLPCANFGSQPIWSWCSGSPSVWHDGTGAGYVRQSNLSLLGGISYGGQYNVIHKMVPATMSSQTWNTVNSHRGIRFKLPSRVVTRGVFSYPGITVATNHIYNLWDVNGFTVLRQAAIGGELIGDRPHYAPWSAGNIELLPDVFYRVTLAPTAATNITQSISAASTAAHLNGMPGGQNCHYTQSTTNPPTQESHWTQTLTSQAVIGIWIDSLDDGV
jgi:hypothetical protein